MEKGKSNDRWRQIEGCKVKEVGVMERLEGEHAGKVELQQTFRGNK